jgi:hypothetical protein
LLLCCTVLPLQTIAEPCDPSSAVDTVIDGSYSTDPSRRALAKYTWSQQGSADPTLQASIDAANAVGAKRVVIPGASLSQLPDGTYTLGLTVVNWLGKSNSATFVFAKVAAGAAPVVGIIGEGVQPFKMAEGAKVASQLQAKSVCPGKRVSDGCGVPAGVLQQLVNTQAACQHIMFVSSMFQARLCLVLQAWFAQQSWKSAQ